MKKEILTQKLNEDTSTDVEIDKKITDETEKPYRDIIRSIEQYGSYYEIKRNASGVWESEPRIYFPNL